MHDICSLASNINPKLKKNREEIENAAKDLNSSSISIDSDMLDRIGIAQRLDTMKDYTDNTQTTRVCSTPIFGDKRRVS
jgi:hypothetical protein